MNILTFSKIIFALYILSAIYYYILKCLILAQIAGGIWADKVGGKLVLGFGVIWWSIATILTPGVAMPAMNNLLSKWIPVSERSISLALVYSGMYLGSVTGLAFSPMLIHKFGWPSVFYSFGSLGSIWFVVWLSKVSYYKSPFVCTVFIARFRFEFSKSQCCCLFASVLVSFHFHSKPHIFCNTPSQYFRNQPSGQVSDIKKMRKQY
ncbi:hypothetical protein KSP40_PGU020782 [Platanthera guangdongensis]|uniref:Major facilitator superfamily (MFS) profile domain-containing protein n=1 Tax=Platanthera guangdongensis TaxID=2320717 RepID=A0ABR2MKW4_9ASPA